MQELRLLAWDSSFFGFPVVLLEDPRLPPTRVAALLHHCLEQGIRLVYWPTLSRMPDLSERWLADHHGQLVDRKVTYRNARTAMDRTAMDRKPAPLGADLVSVPPGAASPELKRLAIRAGHCSRFFVDERIPSGMARRLYEQWMTKSVGRTLADEVLAFTEHGKITGVVTLESADGVGRIGLLAVAADRTQRGIGRRLIAGALQWFAEQDCHSIEVVTQEANEAACRLYESSGFVREQVQPYYHFWPGFRCVANGEGRG